MAPGRSLLSLFAASLLSAVCADSGNPVGGGKEAPLPAIAWDMEGKRLEVSLKRPQAADPIRWKKIAGAKGHDFYVDLERRKGAKQDSLSITFRLEEGPPVPAGFVLARVEEFGKEGEYAPPSPGDALLIHLTAIDADDGEIARTAKELRIVLVE